MLRRGFDSLFFLVGWNLWKERNGRTFDRAGRQPQQLAQAIVEEASLWIAAGYRPLGVLDASTTTEQAFGHLPKMNNNLGQNRVRDKKIISPGW